MLVADLKNASDAERHVTWLAGLAQFKRQPRIDDIDFFLDAKRGGRIDESLGGADIAARAVDAGFIDLPGVWRRHRHGQPNNLAPSLGPNIHRLPHLIVSPDFLRQS